MTKTEPLTQRMNFRPHRLGLRGTTQPPTATLSRHDALLRIEEAMAKCDGLTRYGILRPRRRPHRHRAYNEYFFKRAELLVADYSVDEFLRARAYLEQFSTRKTINLQAGNSYSLKHYAEREAGAYVSNGALIAAAIDLGFSIKLGDYDDPNCWLNIGRRLHRWHQQEARA